jgi:DNA transformation protein
VRTAPAAHPEVAVLEDIPNVGKAIAADLRLIGIRTPRALVGRDPYRLYAALERATGVRHDPCVLDTFIAAVRFVDGGPAVPWWHYTAERKRTLAARRSGATAPTRAGQPFSS